MKKYKKYIAVVAVVVAVYFLVQLYAPRQLNWSPTFVARDKIPFGTSAFREMAGKMPAYTPVKTIYQPIYSQLYEQHHRAPLYYYNSDNTDSLLPDSLRHNYLFINSEFHASDLDVTWLLNDIYRGNDVMICAKDLPDSLKHVLKISMTSTWSANPVWTTKLPEDTYHYRLTQLASVLEYFDKYDTAATNVIGYSSIDSSDDFPDFICVSYGKGHVYINTLPELFTNYYVVNDTTYSYAFNCLNVINNGKPLWWDEYYKEGRIESGNSLEFIFSQPPLKLAWYIFLITMLMYALFESKRRQKAIPVIAPVQNDSLEFVRILGGFYFKTSEHKNMAEKKWRFLMEYIRSRYNINYDRKDTTFAEKLSRKSGYPLDEVTAMLNMAMDYLRRNNITEEELMQLNHSINKFYNYTKII